MSGPEPPPTEFEQASTQRDGRRRSKSSLPAYFTRDNDFQLLSVRPAQNWIPAATQFGRTRGAINVGPWVLTLEAAGGEVAVYNLAWRTDAMTRRANEPPEVLPGPRLAIANLLPGAQPPIECMTRLTTGGEIAFIAHVPDGRALFLLEHRGEKSPLALRAERIYLGKDALPSEVTACAGGFGVVYVALKDRGVRKLKFGEEYTGRRLERRRVATVTETVRLDGSSGPLNFSALAVGDIDKITWEMLYAVAGDDAVYRFSSDLRPDQRIETGLPAGSGKRSDR